MPVSLQKRLQRGFNAGQNIGHISFLKKYELRRKAINSANAKWSRSSI